jgi:hypothetical protein
MNVTYEEVFELLPFEVKERMTVLDSEFLVGNIDEIGCELIEDGYKYGEHFNVESILKDLLPDFLEHTGISLENNINN